MTELQNKMLISVDLMGGDGAPSVILAACNKFLKDFPDCVIKGFGVDLSKEAIYKNYPNLNADNFILIICDSFIASEESPVLALKSSKGSTMRCAIESVERNEAKAIVSAGNTGALMAISKLILKTMSGIDRPALVALLPHMNGSFCMLDLGANTVCESRNLYEFAIMGSNFAKIIFDKNSPKVALLNIGKEEIKGNDTIRGAAELLRGTSINFCGYIEGDQLFEGDIDVVVSDGFSGNVALKTIEGTSKFCMKFIKKVASESFIIKILLFILYPFVKIKLAVLDHRKYNGGVFLGLNGIVVKSHGGADQVAFYNSLSSAYKLVKSNFIERISESVE